MRKAKPKQETGLVKREPEQVAKPAQITPYFVGNINIQEEKDKYIASIQLGKGIKEEDIKFRSSKDSLEFIVSQKQKKEEKDEKKGYYSYQSSAYSYYRKMPLPTGVDAGKITTRFDAGVFYIYLPKKESPKQLGPAKEK